jgi:hypothetical protein
MTTFLAFFLFSQPVAPAPRFEVHMKYGQAGRSTHAKNWWSDSERAKTGRLFAPDEVQPFMQHALKKSL